MDEGYEGVDILSQKASTRPFHPPDKSSQARFTVILLRLKFYELLLADGGDFNMQRHPGDIDRLILTGHELDPTAARTLLEFEQGIRSSVADLNSTTSLLTASGVER